LKGHKTVKPPTPPTPGTQPLPPPSAIVSPAVPTPSGGTAYSVTVPSSGYSQSFVTQPVAPGVIAIPTMNLTTGATYDQINLTPGHMGDITGATSMVTDFAVQVPGAGGGVASVTSSNPALM